MPWRARLSSLILPIPCTALGYCGKGIFGLPVEKDILGPFGWVLKTGDLRDIRRHPELRFPMTLAVDDHGMNGDNVLKRDPSTVLVVACYLTGWSRRYEV
jgi:hypothetical protein